MTLKRVVGPPETKLGKEIEWYVNAKIQEFCIAGIADTVIFRGELREIKRQEREALANYIAVKLEHFLQNWKG